MLWEAEGVEASVALVAANGLSFFVNGKSDGDAIGDAGTQIMLGVLPALLHANPRTGLIVGLGTGETPGWLAEVPGIERVDVVELEPAVDEMARRCAAVNFDVLHHPKVRRIYNDAREVLLTASDRYDIIASEPSNPYRAGVASLFTREFYEASLARLEPEGLFVQWVQGYEIDEQTVRAVLATLRSVFGYVEVWQSKNDDMLLVCSRRPLSYRAARLRDRIAQDPFRTAVACGWRVADLEGLLSRFVAGSALADEVAGEEAGWVNTDDRNRIEYGFARSVGMSTGFSIQDLRQEAVACGAHRPPLDGESEVNWDRVEGHRQILDALAGKIVLPSQPTAEHKARAEAMKLYWQADTKGMVETWERAAYEPLFPSETALLALGYANLGSDKARELTRRLRAFRPTEADAIDAYLASKQGKYRESADLLHRVLTRLRSSPWGLAHALELAFPAVSRVVEADREQAPRLYRALREPLAVWVYEETRRSTALEVARHVGREAVSESLLAYEPYIPWNEELLVLRWQVYRAIGHPLQEQAANDLELLRRQTSVHAGASRR